MDDEGWTYAGEASRILGISAETLRRRSISGEIPCTQLWDGGHRRYRRSVLHAIAAGAYQTATPQSTSSAAH